MTIEIFPRFSVHIIVLAYPTVQPSRKINDTTTQSPISKPCPNTNTFVASLLESVVDVGPGLLVPEREPGNGGEVIAAEEASGEVRDDDDSDTLLPVLVEDADTVGGTYIRNCQFKKMSEPVTKLGEDLHTLFPDCCIPDAALPSTLIKFSQWVYSTRFVNVAGTP